MLTTGGLLRLEREICIPSLQQGHQYSSPLRTKRPLEHKASILNNQGIKTGHRLAPTVGRQQTHSCKGEPPAGKANRKCLGKGTVMLPSRCAQSSAG